MKYFGDVWCDFPVSLCLYCMGLLKKWMHAMVGRLGTWIGGWMAGWIQGLVDAKVTGWVGGWVGEWREG